MNADGTGQTNLTNARGNDFEPAWSPNGHKIAFLKDIGGRFDVFKMYTDGTGRRNLTNAPAFRNGPDWQPKPLATE